MFRFSIYDYLQHKTYIFCQELEHDVGRESGGGYESLWFSAQVVFIELQLEE